jgi:hypothetical protein
MKKCISIRSIDQYFGFALREPSRNPEVSILRDTNIRTKIVGRSKKYSRRKKKIRIPNYMV